MTAMVEGQQQHQQLQHHHQQQQQQFLLGQEEKEQQHGNLRHLSNALLGSVKLLKAGKFAILSKTVVTNPSWSKTVITAPNDNVNGPSPVAASYYKGVSVMLKDSTQTWSWSPTYVTAGEHTEAVLDMEAAYVNATNRTADPANTDLGGGWNLNGLVLEGGGVYKWAKYGVWLTNDSPLTFKGTDTDVWILQVAGDLTIAQNAQMILEGGAKAENIFWQVSGKTQFGYPPNHMVSFVSSQSQGVFLSLGEIVFQWGSRLNGAALSQSNVTLNTNIIVKESVCDWSDGCSLWKSREVGKQQQQQQQTTLPPSFSAHTDATNEQKKIAAALKIAAARAAKQSNINDDDDDDDNNNDDNNNDANTSKYGYMNG